MRGGGGLGVVVRVLGASCTVKRAACWGESL